MTIKITIEFKTVDEAIVGLGKLVAAPARLPSSVAHGEPAAAAIPRRGRSDKGQKRGEYKPRAENATAPVAGMVAEAAGSSVRETGAPTPDAGAPNAAPPAIPEASAKSADVAGTSQPAGAAPTIGDNDTEAKQAVEKLAAGKGIDAVRVLLAEFGVKRLREDAGCRSAEVSGLGEWKACMKHARLSASSAHRWFACPGSINAAPPGGGKSSAAAEEGTLAHDFAANILRPGTFICKWPSPEMQEGVEFYVDVVNTDFQKGDKLWIEMPLLTALQTVDVDLGGTADAVRYRPKDKSLRVFDFKYGAGVYVDADANKQMMLYGVGALLAVGLPVKQVTLTIVQPRFEGAPPVRDWTFPVQDVIDFLADAQEAAVKTRKKDAPLVAGDHCKFCPAAKDCPELERKQHALVAVGFDTLPQLAPEKLAAALASIPQVKERIKAIEEFAYAEANRGVVIPGYKLVDKRAVRRWKNEGDVMIALGDRPAIFEPRELKSPAQMEKTLGKADFVKLCAPFIESKSSGTALVPVADDRPPAKRISADDFEVLSNTQLLGF